jgi:signal transduction histidine kinase
MRMRDLARRFTRIRPLPALVLDASLAIIFVAATAIEWVLTPLPGGASAVIAALLTLVLAASLIIRRKLPLVALLVGTAALSLESFLNVATTLSPLPTLICAYSVGLYATRTRARWGALVIAVGVLVYFAGTPGFSRSDPIQVLVALVSWLAMWVVGYSFARRREEQEHARRAVARQVVAEERARMSRELHDLIGHTVNLLIVQAGAARLMLDKDPTKTRELLQSMEQTGRETLTDLDHVLASLRADTDGRGLSSTESQVGLGVAQLPDLVERFSDSGIDVRLTVDPALVVPPTLDVPIYRIVQEALTNALKHAAPCSVAVSVQRDGRSVIIDVRDTGPGLRDTNPHGRGLVGIKERVSMRGGSVEYGGGERGGFGLRAVLPMP